MKRTGIFLTCVCFAFLSTNQEVQAFIPNDPHAEQWGYEITDVYDAWDITTGSRNVVVAVIDNGFDQYHTDLTGNVWKNKKEIPRNGIDDDNNGYVDDVHGWNFVGEDSNGDGLLSAIEEYGNNDLRPNTKDLNDQTKKIVNHGTFVAGLIGAKGGNGLHGAGLNWEVSLMNIKIVGSGGSGTLGKLDDAIRYSVDNGASIISMSIIGGVETEDANDIEAAVAYAYANDVVLVGAAGNNFVNLNASPLYPICADKNNVTTTIIGSSAIRPGRSLALFSNYGSDCIDITAPGVNINSIGKYAPSAGLDHAYLHGYQGTSFAVPFISGTAALIRSVRPDLSAASVIDSILSSVTRTPPADEAAYANLYGKGLLNVANALRYAQELPFNADKANAVTFKEQAYQFSADAFVGVVAPSDRLFTTDNIVSATVANDMVTTVDAKKRSYTWAVPTKIGTITEISLDTTERIPLLMFTGTDGIAWYGLSGFGIFEMDFTEFDTVYDTTIVNGTIIVLAQKGTQVLTAAYDRDGTKKVESSVSIDQDISAGVLNADGMAYVVTASLEQNTVYTMHQNELTPVFETAGAFVYKMSLLEIGETNIVLFSNNTGTIWSLQGELLQTFDL